jgi:transcriptional regulator GlxA family with amidase domain
VAAHVDDTATVSVASAKKDRLGALQNLHAMAGACGYKSQELARALGITQRHLQRLFAAQFGRGPQEWLNEQRLEAAGQMLRKAQAVKEVAYRLGFPSASQLSRDFRNYFGVKPSTLLIQRGED